MKEKLEALVSLHNARLERFDRSRSIQWKINGLLWAAMVVITGFLLTSNIQPFEPVTSLIVSTSLIVLHAFTVHKIQTSLDWDRRALIHYHKLINEEAQLPAKFKEFIEKDSHSGHAWYIIQIVTTALIAIVASALLSLK